jgi:hypothetical protein
MDQKVCEINIKECGICQESNNEKSLISRAIVEQILNMCTSSV